jgi:hypothetical protein
VLGGSDCGRVYFWLMSSGTAHRRRSRPSGRAIKTSRDVCLPSIQEVSELTVRI